MKLRIAFPIGIVTALVLSALGGAATTPTVTLQGNLSPLLSVSTDLGAAPTDQVIQVVWSLQLRNQADLAHFLGDVQDPASPIFHKFLTQDQFNARYAPTSDQEQAVIGFLTANGFTVTQTFPNHLLVAAQAHIGVVESVFGVQIDTVAYNGVAKYATLNEPTIPADLAAFTVGILGLDNIGDRHPMNAGGTPVLAPNDALGTSCCYFSPRDTNVAYNENQATNTGAGQNIAIAGAYDFKDTDLSAFNSQFGIPAAPSVNRVCVYGGGSLPLTCKFSTQNSIEISLDIEYSHGTAHSAGLWSYMAQSTAFTDFTTMENRVVTDNHAHSVSESWGACENAIASSTITSEDNVFANGNAVGQTWFFASGDDGNKDCSNGTVIGVDYPGASPYVTSVGGTHLTCSSGMTASQPVCGGYGSESAWSGSGGGFSTVHSKPSWQTGCGVPADGHRDVPDVALEADTSPGNLVAKGGNWYAVGGTSDAAPQLAGMFAALNAHKGGSGLGNAGARLYALCGGNTYHDITTGSNGYSAGVGFDEVTGLGTINEGNLLTNY